MTGTREVLRKRVLASLLALTVSIAGAATVGAVAAHAQEDGQTSGVSEQGFDKWGQLLGLAGLAGLGGLALQRTDEKKDDNDG